MIYSPTQSDAGVLGYADPESPRSLQEQVGTDTKSRGYCTERAMEPAVREIPRQADSAIGKVAPVVKWPTAIKALSSETAAVSVNAGGH